MKAYLYHIEAITNLQVCSGEENFGVVDNLIQRDAATGFPAINASSLKGALREFFEQTQPQGVDINNLFGSKPNEQNNLNAGALRFLDAHLLAMPVRSNKTPYLMATCPELILEYIKKCELFHLSLNEYDIKYLESILSSTQFNKPIVFKESLNGAFIEDLDLPTLYINSEWYKSLENLINNENIVLFSNEIFQKLCDNDHLPIIARNCLDGEGNLWYEQVLPRLTQMYFFVLANDNTDLSKFTTALSSQLVQIGANASVGYGFCQITQVK